MRKFVGIFIFLLVNATVNKIAAKNGTSNEKCSFPSRTGHGTNPPEGGWIRRRRTEWPSPESTIPD